MKTIKLLSSFIVAIVLLYAATASAQDATTLYIDRTQLAGWNFSVRDGNVPSHLQINYIGLKILTPGVIFIGQGTSGAASDWSANAKNNDSVYYTASSGWISYPNADSMFSFGIDFPYALYDHPIQIRWNTMLTSTKLTTGIWTLFPTTFQTFSAIDTVKMTSNLLSNGDPNFTFNVLNRNSPNYAINAMSFQVYNPAVGQIRPSDVHAPAGWVLDSVRAYNAYFHANSGSEIQSGKNLSGFSIGLRSSASPQVFAFVWRAYESTNLADSGAFIDRDTVVSASVTPGSGSADSSIDTLTTTNNGCSFAITIANDHVSNGSPPSPISRVVLTSQTSGVTVASASAPNNWASSPNGSVSYPAPSVIYQAAATNFALPSGQSAAFGVNFNNPSGNAFNLGWQTFTDDTTLVSSGTLNLSCQVIKTNDTAILTGGSNCNYTLTVTNKHNPNPSKLVGISLQIPASAGKFAKPTGSSNLKWGISESSDDQSILFFKDTGSDMASSATQALTFSIIPNTPGASVPITWKTFDATSSTNPITSGVVTGSCTIVPACDSVMWASPSANCQTTLRVQNLRGTHTPVTNIAIVSTNGWKVYSSNSQGWIATRAATGDTLLLSNPTGVIDGQTSPGFLINFSGTGGKFAAIVHSIDQSFNVCTSVDSFTCAPNESVSPADAGRLLAMSVAPNPFSGNTEISFTLSAHEPVNLVLLDVLGRTVETVFDAPLDSGNHIITMNGGSLPAGTYYLRLETPEGRMTRNVVVTR